MKRKVQVTMTIEYETNGVPIEDLGRRLDSVIRDLFTDGKVTGDTDAKVISARREVGVVTDIINCRFG